MGLFCLITAEVMDDEMYDVLLEKVKKRMGISGEVSDNGQNRSE